MRAASPTTTAPVTVTATAPALLAGMLDRDPGGVALIAGETALTWERLATRVHDWAAFLQGSGLAVGDRIACVLGNGADAVVVLLAALHTGVTLVPVNWHLTAAEIAYILRDSGSRLVVTGSPYTATVAAAVAAGPGAGCVLVDVDAVADRPDAGPRAALDQTCGATMMYTSGTTGQPKGVVNNLFRTGAPFSAVDRMAGYAETVLGVQPSGRMLLAGPWYHSSQLFFALLSLLRGSRLVVESGFDPARLLAVIDREAITSTHLVPTQMVRLLRLDPAARAAFDGGTLEIVWHGGGPCPPPAKRAMIDWWGPVWVEYYGATEGGAITLIDSAEWLARPGSVGRAVPPNQITIVDGSGAELPAGQAGRVFVRRAGGSRFHYHNAPEKTRSAHLDERTFTVGELGRLDDAGYLYLTGRSAELIVSGGVNVYPAEVEAVLAEHEWVSDVAVLGLPDEEFGERVAALVERTAAAGAGAPVAAALDAFARRVLAGFKVPRSYVFVDEIPREPTGKIRRSALAELVANHPPFAGGMR